MKLIQDAWETFAKRCLPVGVSRLQYREMKIAFYAGAEAHLATMTRILGPGREATESDLTIMDGIMKEFEEFAQNLKEGRV